MPNLRNPDHNSVVPRDTLIGFFQDLGAIRAEFLVHDDGFRRRSYTYADVTRGARGFAARLAAAGVARGDKIILWGENRPEWIACYWGCVISGVIVVPIDYRSSPEFVTRVRGLVDARVVIAGDDVVADAVPAPIWRFADLDWSADGPMPTVAVTRDDILQIIFTSGATAEPKGVVIRHRNVMANIIPVEREIAKYPDSREPFQQK